MKKRYTPVIATTMAAIGSLFCNTHSSRAAEAVPQNGSDARFLQKAAQSGAAELRMAKMGAEKASKATVKTFAEMLVKDHTKVNEQIKELAATKGINLDVEAAPETEAGKNLEEQSSLIEERKVKTTEAPTVGNRLEEDKNVIEGRKPQNAQTPNQSNGGITNTPPQAGIQSEGGTTITPGQTGNDSNGVIVTPGQTGNPSIGGTTRTPAEAGNQSDSDFDKQFLASTIKSHKKGIDLYQDASEDSKDADVKAFAAMTLPVLKAHLSKAQELSGEGTDENPDNTRVNLRDRDSKEVTPFDQGNSEADIDRTAQIRKEVVALDKVSSNAKNVKIITKDGHVTLRGPVESAEEKKTIRDIAARVATEEHVTDELEVKADKEEK